MGSSPTEDYGLYGEMANTPEVVKKAFLTCAEQLSKLLPRALTEEAYTLFVTIMDLR